MSDKKEYRPRLSEDEWSIVQSYRGLRDEISADNGVIDHGWMKTKELSAHFKIDNSKDVEKLVEKHIEQIRGLSPYQPLITQDSSKDSHCLILNPCDVHIGKLCDARETGDEYNHDIAVARMKSAILEIFTRANRYYNIDRVIFIGGNDMLHVDNPFRKTTANTPQDTTGQWWSNYELAWRTCVDIINSITNSTPVHFVHCPSNHDFMSGYHLAQTIAAYFEGNENVTVDVSNAHRKYVSYGKSLLGFTHGDGAKEADLPNLMASEARAAWGGADYKYWFCGHLHHKIKKQYAKNAAQQVEKDYMDVTVFQTGVSVDPVDNVKVEYLRSPSGTDAWHDRNGYSQGKKAIEAFVFHPSLGERDRLVEFF